MKNSIEKLITQNAWDNYYDLSKEEQTNFHSQILDCATSDTETFKKFCLSLEPTNFSPLEIIYNALCSDISTWGDLLFAEYTRIWNMAMLVDEPKSLLSCIDLVDNFKHLNNTFCNRVIDFLIEVLENGNAKEKHTVLVTLPLWIDETNVIKYHYVTSKITQCLNDPNFEISYNAYFVLTQYLDIEENDIEINIKNHALSFEMENNKSIMSAI